MDILQFDLHIWIFEVYHYNIVHYFWFENGIIKDCVSTDSKINNILFNFHQTVFYSYIWALKGFQLMQQLPTKEAENWGDVSTK